MYLLNPNNKSDEPFPRFWSVLALWSSPLTLPAEKLSVANQGSVEQESAVSKAMGKKKLASVVKERLDGDQLPAAPSGPLGKPAPSQKEKITKSDVKTIHKHMDAVDAEKNASTSAERCGRKVRIVNLYVERRPDDMKTIGVKKVSPDCTNEKSLDAVLHQIRQHFAEQGADMALPFALGSLIFYSEYALEAGHMYKPLGIVPGAAQMLGQAICDGRLKKELDSELDELRCEYGYWLSHGLFSRLAMKLMNLLKEVSSAQLQVRGGQAEESTPIPSVHSTL